MMSPETAAPLVAFLLGYLAVLAAPGPNMLAIGALAALRGFRGVLPFCAGVAAGAFALAAALYAISTRIAGADGLDEASRAAGGLLLLVIAVRVINAPRPLEERPQAKPGATWHDDLVAVGAGFATAVTNPMTAAYFLAQFLGPLAQGPAGLVAIPLVALQALCIGLLVALVFVQPAARRLARRHHRGACLAAGAVLAMLAATMVWPLLR